MSLHSQWLSLFCEQWQKPGGDLCEYWRVEKPNSLIVIPLYKSQVLFPPPDYRPGAGECTLDLPGGRVDTGRGGDIVELATRILSRELGLDPRCISRIDPIDAKGTFVNSSFNNQKLLIARADLSGVDGVAEGVTFYPLTELPSLLNEIECLQCSYALLRFLQSYQS